MMDEKEKLYEFENTKIVHECAQYDVDKFVVDIALTFAEFAISIDTGEVDEYLNSKATIKYPTLEDIAYISEHIKKEYARYARLNKASVKNIEELGRIVAMVALGFEFDVDSFYGEFYETLEAIKYATRNLGDICPEVCGGDVYPHLIIFWSNKKKIVEELSSPKTF